MQAYPKQWRSPFPTEGVRGTRTLEMLQSRLYQAAKADRKRRFHTLDDKICRMDILREAWKHVAKNRGTPGIDGGTIEAIEKTGADEFLRALQRELVEESYRVQCVKRVYIPKPDGGKRPLGIPTVKDRVVQQAVRLIIEPIFEADFQEFSYGYRPKRSAKQASLAVYKWLNYGLTEVIEVDIEGFFDHVNHQHLKAFLMERIADGYILKLITEWLRAGVVYFDTVTYSEMGTPQGGVISPLLANIYLNRLDEWWNELGMNQRSLHNAQLVRYADDIVIFTDKDATTVLGILTELLRELGLKLKAEKIKATNAHEGFDFLSFHFMRRYQKRHGKQVTYFYPSKKAAERFRSKIAFTRTCVHNLNHGALILIHIFELKTR
jgi:group II intron reverse transcriptase/maturase